MVKKNFGIKDAGIALSMYLWGKVGKGNRIK
jgi:predicted ATPase